MGHSALLRISVLLGYSATCLLLNYLHLQQLCVERQAQSAPRPCGSGAGVTPPAEPEVSFAVSVLIRTPRGIVY